MVWPIIAALGGLFAGGGAAAGAGTAAGAGAGAAGAAGAGAGAASAAPALAGGAAATGAASAAPAGGVMGGGFGTLGGGGAGGGLWQDLITPYSKPAPEPKWYDGLFGDDGEESQQSGPRQIQIERGRLQAPQLHAPPTQQRQQRQMIERQLPPALKSLMGG